MRDPNPAKPQASTPITVVVLAALAAVLILGTGAGAQTLPSSGYLSFDAPSAGTGSYQGTYPSAINRNGWISGTVVYSTGFSHGFLRMPNGSFIAVNPPGSVQSLVASINNSNEAVGTYYNGTETSYGFLRDAAGNFTTLAVPGAYSTNPSGINDRGEVVGFASFSGAGSQGFFWTAQHGYTLFVVPGSATNTTIATAINATGTIVGTYGGTDFYTYDFVRSPGGQFSTFEAIYGGTATQMTAINASGQTTGWGNDGNGDTDGFLGDAHGTVSQFGIDQGTDGTAINESGVIVGYGFSDGGGPIAFEREPDGTINILTIPFSNTGAEAVGINSQGVIVGNYTDSANASHGWVGAP
jgi:hypothetical protein